MTGDLVLAATATSAAESAVFYILAPIAVLTALAMVLVRNAVHAALLLVANFFCLAVFYAVQQAPFLAAVQVIVYAGAIMVLFLFVLMLVGVDSSDSLVETLRGQRVAAVGFGLGFAGLVVAAVAPSVRGVDAVGLDDANAGGNVQAIARLLFTDYVFAFEVTSALLIVAAVGAMVLGHREVAPGARRSQRETVRQRFRGGDPSPLPGPGVYALHHGVDTPALLPDGGPARISLMPEFEGAVSGEPGPTGQLPRPASQTLEGSVDREGPAS